MSKITLDSEQNFPEIYVLSSINLVGHNCNSITVLLRENEYGSVIMICRNLMEMFFNLHWAIEPIDTISDKTILVEAIKDRFFRLQGTPFYLFEKALDSMERKRYALSSWNFNDIMKTRELIENEKKKYPFLLTKDEEGKLIFKKAPPFAERMGHLKIEHYHSYTFSSIFTHPTPIISSIYHLGWLNSSPQSINMLKKIISSGIFYVHAILGYGNIAFENFEFKEIRQDCFNALQRIYQKSQNDSKI